MSLSGRGKIPLCVPATTFSLCPTHKHPNACARDELFRYLAVRTNFVQTLSYSTGSGDLCSIQLLTSCYRRRFSGWSNFALQCMCSCLFSLFSPFAFSFPAHVADAKNGKALDEELLRKRALIVSRSHFVDFFSLHSHLNQGPRSQEAIAATGFFVVTRGQQYINQVCDPYSNCLHTCMHSHAHTHIRTYARARTHAAKNLHVQVLPMFLHYLQVLPSIPTHLSNDTRTHAGLLCECEWEGARVKVCFRVLYLARL